MVYILVWADDQFATEAFDNRLKAHSHISDMYCYLGDSSDCLHTRPNKEGTASWFGIRPIWASTPIGTRLAGVWLEYGVNTCKVDPRDYFEKVEVQR